MHKIEARIRGNLTRRSVKNFKDDLMNRNFEIAIDFDNIVNIIRKLIGFLNETLKITIF